MLLSLDADAMRLYCKGDVEYVGENDLFLLCAYIASLLPETWKL
jgi:hypothetical protein